MSSVYEGVWLFDDCGLYVFYYDSGLVYDYLVLSGRRFFCDYWVVGMS